MCRGCSQALRKAKQSPNFVASSIVVGLEMLAVYHADNSEGMILERDSMDSVFLLKNLSMYASKEDESPLAGILMPMLGMMTLPLIKGAEYMVENSHVDAVRITLSDAYKGGGQADQSMEDIMSGIQVTPHTSQPWE